MSPREHGAELARSAQPLRAEQVEQAARVLAGIQDSPPRGEATGEAPTGAGTPCDAA